MNRQEYLINYRKEHKDELKQKAKIYTQKHKEETKNYQEEHKEEIKANQKKYYQEHKIELKEKIKQYQKEHRTEIKEYKKIYKQKRQETDISYKLSNYLRTRIWWALKGNIKSAHTIELIGCSIEQFRNHLESQFKPNMSWSNYGKWHVDHIRPCSSFDLSNIEQQKLCFNYANLQPLWAEENLTKYNKYETKGV